MSNTHVKNIKLGACKVSFGGVDLGYTKGGVQVEIATETLKVTVNHQNTGSAGAAPTRATSPTGNLPAPRKNNMKSSMLPKMGDMTSSCIPFPSAAKNPRSLLLSIR